MRFRGKPSRRELLLLNKAAIDFIAAAADKTHEFTTRIPPKRDKVRRPVERTVPLESAVNDEIYSVVQQRKDLKFYRNNRGIATYGNSQVRYGVGPNGASDWIGYRRILITEEHVGLTFAQFAVLEAKRPGEKPDEHQRRFIDDVNAAGGWGGWTDSAENLLAMLPPWGKDL